MKTCIIVQERPKCYERYSVSSTSMIKINKKTQQVYSKLRFPCDMTMKMRRGLLCFNFLDLKFKIIKKISNENISKLQAENNCTAIFRIVCFAV